MKNLGAPNPDERLKEEFLGVQLFLDLFSRCKTSECLDVRDMKAIPAPRPARGQKLKRKWPSGK